MQEGAKRLDAILRLAYDFITCGKNLKEVDAFIHDQILVHEGKPSFLGYHGYPASSCLSLNDVVVHGIPNKYVLKDGDVLGVDIGLLFDGYHTDAAFTKGIGELTDQQTQLLQVTQKALRLGVEAAVAGNTTQDIGRAVADYVTGQGDYGIIRELTGHGVGSNLQEAPEVPNYITPEKVDLVNGMTLAIEPMISLGGWRVTIDHDDWTVRTADRSLAAHFETTIVIQENDPLVLVPFPLSSTI